MDVKGANPFLFNDDDYTSPNSGNSNPFLMGDDDFMDSSGGNDNPFLSQSATTVAPAAMATNPFAFDPMDLGPTEAQPADIVTTYQQTYTSNAFVDTSSHVNFFTEANVVNHDFLIDTNVGIPSIIPQKPTDLDLKFTNSVSSDIDDASNGVPRRPPPPRPPPSKETQDLLMSVMGEMDATSSHLLDRIPPTRTPSPVSMRDLHSPSPTPEPQFGDLLDVSDAKTETTAQHQQHNDDDLFMSLTHENDINQNPPAIQNTNISQSQSIMESAMNESIMQQPVQPDIEQFAIHHPVMEQPIMQQTMMQQPVMQQPIMQQPVMQQPVMQQPIIQQQPPMPQNNLPPARPTPPVRPPRPQPPQKPPPPNIPSAPQAAAPPPKPPPPVAQKITSQEDEYLEMFSAQAQAPKTTADILNLYNAKQETPVDLLSDSLDAPAPTTDAIETSVSECNSRKSSVPSSENIVINANAPAQVIETSPHAGNDNLLSPQGDMQMDTSDSQSKGSASSVTFNPFAAVEETSPTNPSVIPSQDFSSSIDNGGYHEEFTESNTFPNESIESTNTDTYFQPNTETSNFIDNTNEQKDTANIFGTIDNDAYHSETPFSIFGTNTISTTKAFETANNTFSTSNAFESNDTKLFGTTNETDNFGSTMSTSADLFGSSYNESFGSNNTQEVYASTFGKSAEPDAFDAFAAKFESARDENKNGAFDAFGAEDTWGNDTFNDTAGGFGAEEPFDAFLSLREPPAVPQSTPNKFNTVGSVDSDEEKDFSVVIRPKSSDEAFSGALPVLAPPPAVTSAAFSDASRINPFDQSEFSVAPCAAQDFALPLGGEMKRSDSQETPPSPLFDDDVSQPLEPFPRVEFKEEGWEMHLRQPNKKKITGQRFWKKIFVKLVYQQDCVLLQLFNQQSDKDPFQELPLQPCYSVSDIGAQQYDNFGKIFTLKLQYIFYKERPGVRPGQVKKAERITNKLSQFAAYAIQGDYQGCKEFGSDLKKLGLPVEHAPQVSQLMKLGSLNYEDLKQFSVTIEEAVFKLQAHRDRALHYKMEEVQVTAVDELYVEQDSEGHVEKQIARVRLFFLGFLTGMPDIELGVNDMRRQGKEVVGRHDIIPVVTEEWIRLENVEFHSCVQQVEYNDTHIIKFKPPDACYIELLRFRVRPPKNRELPLQLKAQICCTGTKIELRADVLVPGFASRKLGQVPCEDVMIRFPIPECWIYMFRVEKHFRYGSVKSAHRRTGKIKGIERILGTVDTLQESLIEVTSGQAKYEHQHRAIVWRCPRLPKEGQGAYTTHNMVCRLSLTSYDQMPDQLAEYAYVEFTMPATQVSHTTVRSVSLQNSDSDEPPEKYVRYLARHEYRVGIEHTEGEGPAAYVAATQISKPPPPIVEEKPKTIPEADSSSDSD